MWVHPQSEVRMLGSQPFQEGLESLFSIKLPVLSTSCKSLQPLVVLDNFR